MLCLHRCTFDQEGLIGSHSMLGRLRAVQKEDHHIDVGSISKPKVQHRIILTQVSTIALRLAHGQPRQGKEIA